MRRWAAIAAVLWAASWTTAFADSAAAIAAHERGDFHLALLEWRTLADRHDAEAQYRLARMFFFGEGVAQDLEASEYWLSRAADRGHSEAVGYLALRAGRIQPARLVGDAARGDAMAQYYLGRHLRTGPGAAAWYQRAAMQGVRDAQYRLGTLYFFGDGVHRDVDEAELWWRRAASQSSVLAYLAIAELYYNDEFGRRDPTQAADWYRRAAHRGEPLSQLRLGLMFSRGEGVPYDRVQAYAWWSLGPEQQRGPDDPLPRMFYVLRSELAPTMTQDEVVDARRLARQWSARLW